MNPLVLTEPVQISGPNYYGPNATLTIAPSDEEGWHWQSNGVTRKITPEICSIWGHRLRLRTDARNSLEIYEHIGPLAWTGLTNVAVSCSGRIPPYLAAGSLWKAVEKKTRVTSDQEIGWITVDRPMRWAYPEVRAGHESFTEVRPARSRELTIELLIDYNGIGSKAGYFCLPSQSGEQALLAALNAPSPGWPPTRRRWFDLARKLGWPNWGQIAWPQDHDVSQMREIMINHRIQDVLGAFSLLCQSGCLFAGHISSVYSGHMADLQVVKEAFGMLRAL